MHCMGCPSTFHRRFSLVGLTQLVIFLRWKGLHLAPVWQPPGSDADSHINLLLLHSAHLQPLSNHTPVLRSHNQHQPSPAQPKWQIHTFFKKTKCKHTKGSCGFVCVHVFNRYIFLDECRFLDLNVRQISGWNAHTILYTRHTEEVPASKLERRSDWMDGWNVGNHATSNSF